MSTVEMLGSLFIVMIVVSIPLIALIFYLYKEAYYKSEKFLTIKQGVSTYIMDYNELNNYLCFLRAKSLQLFNSQSQNGLSNYVDTSRYNYQHKHYSNVVNSRNVYNCSLQVLKAAREKPFDYVCKYFEIKKTEESLHKFEAMLNDYSSIQQGLLLLNNKRCEILNSIKQYVPRIIQSWNGKELERRLGLEAVRILSNDYPVCRFSYVSAGGNSSQYSDVVFDLQTMERFISYLNQAIKYRKSAAGQRALMTKALREEIKNRDNHTCCLCGNSVHREPNLLLEIDHIIPISKGGLTERSNLQTLCWKCNRSKGNKL